MKIRAPAKINFGLRVVGKRSDGYHLLDTIMVPVSLYDEIELTRGKRVRSDGTGYHQLTVTCDHPAVPEGKENLVYKAASAFLNEHGIEEPVKIRIVKRIPVAAGLGGGSTDAAATLLGLTRLFRVRDPLQKLLRLAARLGADVPFFIRGVPARARGMGERLRPVPEFPALWAVILYPGIAVSTKWVYSNLHLKLTKPTANTSITALLRDRHRLAELLVNDLEAVTIKHYPRVGVLKSKLLQIGAAGALMSGSGSAVFGIFFSRQKAHQGFTRLRKEEGVETFLVRVLSKRSRY